MKHQKIKPINALWQKKTIWVMVLLGLIIFCLSSTSSFYENSFYINDLNPTCYQETANDSNIKDGNCGLTYTGSYEQAISPTMYDGDWNTGQYVSSPILFMINYSKPSGSIGGKWITYNGATYDNFTLTSDCFNAYANKLLVRINRIPPLTYQCYDGSTWVTLGSRDVNGINEEAMEWDLSNTTTANLKEENLTITANITKTRYLKIPESVKFITNANFSINPKEYISYNFGYQDLSKSLIAYYGFNNGTDFLDDYGKYGINGTKMGNPTQTDGIMGGAFNFDGSNDYINLTTNSILKPKFNFTINTWLYPVSFSNGRAWGGWFNISAPSYSLIRLWGDDGTQGLGEGNKFGFAGYSNGAWVEPTSTTIIQNNRWYMVTFVGNDTGIAVYINGTYEGSDSIETGLQSSYSMWTIGWAGGTTSKWKGKIDEFAFWNRSLNSSEVMTLYGFNYTKNNFPINLNVTTNGTAIFQSGGVYNSSGNNTINFYSLLNNQIPNCIKFQGYCYIPISFKSNGNAIINYGGIQVNSFGFVENNQIYSGNVTEYTSSTFKLNITYDTSYYTSISGNLFYNNTLYSGTKFGTGNNILFSRTIILPEVNTLTTIPFYWIITLNNGTNYEYYNSSNYTQQVNNLQISTCNASNNIRLLNFTTYSEITREQLLSPTYTNNYKITLKIGDYLLNNYLTYSANSTGNSFAICTNSTNSTNLRMDYIMEYTTTGYDTEYYSVQNMSINYNSYGQNISLYPINLNNYTNFILKIKDENSLAVDNAVVEIYRKYNDIGSYLLVESPITDSLGQAIGHLQKNDVFYKIIIRKDNAVLYQFNDIQVYCNEIVSDCVLSLQFKEGSTNPTGSISSDQISYVPTYSFDTRTYTLSFQSLDSTEKKVDIYGFILSNEQSTNICSNTINASSGTMDCVFSGTFENQTVLINAYANGKLLFVDYVSAGYKKSDTLGNVRYILLAFMIPLFAMFSLASGSIAIIFYLIGLLFGIGIYALNSKSILGAGSFLIWFVVAGVILIIKILKGGIKNG